MIALLLAFSAATVPTLSDRLVNCQFGRVTGADAHNQAIIEGSFKLAALIHSSGEIELKDTTPLLTKSGGSHVRAVESADGKLSLIADRDGSWTPALAIDPAQAGKIDRVATLMRIEPTSGSFDHNWFYDGHCSVMVSVDAATRFKATK